MPTESDLAMNAEIQKAISAHLPSQVGEALQKRLKLCNELEAKVKCLEETAARKDARMEALEGIQSKCQEILKREQKLAESEIDFAKRAAVLEARKELIANMLDRDMAIIQAVFSNNRFKYAVSSRDGHAFLAEPTASNPYPCPQTTTTESNKVVEGEQ